MNLKNVKKVGFIENFNPRKSYPEFAIAEKVKPSPKIKKFKLQDPELVAAKKEFNRTKPVGYKPMVLVSTKF